MIENDVVINLLHNRTYFTKYIKFMDSNFFQEEFRVIIDKIISFYEKYNSKPTSKELITDIMNDNKVSDSLIAGVNKILNQNYNIEEYSEEWLKDNTEKFILNGRAYNALTKLVLLQNGGKDVTTYADIMGDAVNITFDDYSGYDYVKNLEERFEKYRDKEAKFDMPIKLYNDITNGGVEKKTLNVILGGTGIGKTLFLCNFAKHHFERGLNVLYISLEMSELKISQRIDANYFDTNQNELDKLTDNKVSNMKKNLELKYKDNFLIIKQFPTGSATANDIKNVISKIEIERDKKIDIVVVDYIGILGSINKKVDGYEKGKLVTEELRALAIEKDVVVYSAQQLNRQGSQSSSVSNADIAESYGMTFCADFILAIVETDELLENNELKCIQLKNRYGGLNKNKEFLIKVDKALAKLYDDTTSLSSQNKEIEVKKVGNSNKQFMKQPANTNLNKVIF